MHTNLKGAIAEQKVVLRALEKGLIVSKPVVDCRYDLIIDNQGKLERAQVKYGNGTTRNSEGSISVSLTSWDHDGSGHRDAKQSRTYTSEEVDCILVYLPKKDVVVRLSPKLFDGKKSLVLRYEASKNNQKKGVHLVEDLRW